MKKYHLRILYPSSNSFIETSFQYYKEIIEATDYEVLSGGSIQFYSSEKIIALYPVQYTIIEKIEEKS